MNEQAMERRMEGWGKGEEGGREGEEEVGKGV